MSTLGCTRGDAKSIRTCTRVLIGVWWIDLLRTLDVPLQGFARRHTRPGYR